MKIEIDLETGCLHLNLRSGAERLDDLLCFASRQNPKRGYLFVSKVLGKHIPVRPSRMRIVYSELAELVAKANQPDGAILIIGMAETATGLGAGVADELARLVKGVDVIYQHTTRHAIEKPVLLQIDEIHSHAVTQILYLLNEELRCHASRISRLVLIDDEVSTGRTLRVLAKCLLPHLHTLQDIIFVTIAEWLSPADRRRIEQLPVPVRIISLVQGSLHFEVRNGFKPQLPRDVDKDLYHGRSREDLGRLGMIMPYKSWLTQDHLPYALPDSFPPPNGAGGLAVIGTGEHLFEPFLFAEHLEQRGYDVMFQSTTRSPILIGGAIQRKLEFRMKQGRASHYCYNLDPSRRTLVCEEFPEIGEVKLGGNCQ